MKKKSNIRAVMCKEFSRFFGDRRLVLTTILLPGLMIYLLYSLMGGAMGSLFAQPDAVIEIEAGLISLEYKSRGGRNDNPADPASTLRPKDLLQTLIEAMVLSVSTGRPVAPVLRTHNAAYFLRPERRIMALLADRIAAAEDFVSPYSERRGISAGDYAALCVVPAEMLFTHPANASSLAGEAAHKSLLG